MHRVIQQTGALLCPTPREARVFARLVRVAHDTQSTVRIAGGWVRDRILKHHAKPDVDVAIDNMTGVAFATRLQDHGQSFGIIKRNPAQSKHLETAVITMGGLSLDLVNLRHEGYAATSRIPTHVRLGTPAEDAWRRDFTINALFYNLTTRQVEDWTGHGLDDLAARCIRTPLDPAVTFQEDPLRMLRALRFAARFQFTLDPALQEALGHPTLHHALAHLVSRPRVADELRKLFETAVSPTAAVGAIETMSDKGMHHVVFPWGPRGTSTTTTAWPTEEWERALVRLQRVARLDTQRISLPLALACIYGVETTIDVHRLPRSLAETSRHVLRVVRDDHKLSLQEARQTALLVDRAGWLVRYLRKHGSLDDLSRVDAPAFREVALWLRSSSAVDMDELIRLAVATAGIDILAPVSTAVHRSAAARAHTEAPVVTGAVVKRILQQVSRDKFRGRHVSTALSELVAWQVGHPLVAKAEAMTWVRAYGEQLYV